MPIGSSDDRTFVAVMLTAVNCGCLWWWTYTQWVLAFYFGFPIFSQGNHVRALGYYVPIDGIGLSVPQVNLLLTCVGIFILIPSAWVFTMGARGRKRMLIVIAIFISMAFGFSFKVLDWKATHLTYARHHIEWLQTYLQPPHGDDRLRIRQIEEIQGAILAATQDAKH